MNPEQAERGNERITVDVDRAWTLLMGRLEKDGLVHGRSGPAKAYRMPVLRIAASIIVLAVMSIAVYVVLSPGGQDTGLAAEASGREACGLSLPDGSQVDLNAHSRIRFTSDDAGSRKVELKGEAYFDVMAESGKPFIVTAGRAVIRVTGTRFSVRSGPSVARTEVYVESGSVQLYRSGYENERVMLHPGEIGILDEGNLEVIENKDENYLSWKTRKLKFSQTRLEEVARTVNRTYRKEILFDNDELMDCRFTGTFDREPMDSVVLAIQLAFGLDVDQKRDSYVLSGEGCN